MKTNFNKTFTHNGTKFFANSAKVVDDVTAPVGCVAVTWTATSMMTHFRKFGKDRAAANDFANMLNSK